MARSDRRAVAERTEQLALEHLTANGLGLIERNFRCRHGEIDLIMQDRVVIVFVEVRFRTHSRFASAADSVDLRKQRKLYKTASHFLRLHPRFRNAPVRFDVVAFDGPTQQDFKLQWLADAFRPTGREI
jgi:putative endonuclease